MSEELNTTPIETLYTEPIDDPNTPTISNFIPVKERLESEIDSLSRRQSPLTITDVASLVEKLQVSFLPLVASLMDHYAEDLASFKIRDYFQEVYVNLIGHVDNLNNLGLMGDSFLRASTFTKLRVYLIDVNKRVRTLERPSNQANDRFQLN